MSPELEQLLIVILKGVVGGVLAGAVLLGFVYWRMLQWVKKQEAEHAAFRRKRGFGR